jgi:membrane protein implicated in regulation of membrane protease activity
MLSAWMIWMIIGIICIVIEIFDPAFFFFSLGAAAIVTGLLSLLIPSTALQIIIFAVLSLIAFLSMRKLGKKILSVADKDTNVFALRGKSAVVIREIPAHGRGYVKVGGEEWSAVGKDNQAIEQDARVVVVDIDGNKLVVEKQEA